MPHHHMQHVQNVGPNLFVRNENITHVMRCGTRCNDVMHSSHGAHMQASQPPYVYMVCQELLMDVPFAQANLYLSKLTASYFSTLNTIFANRNVLKRILIAMLNKNKADCNENFSICAEESVAPLYKW